MEDLPYYVVTVKKEGCFDDCVVQTCGIDTELYLTVECGDSIMDLCEKMEGVTITYKTKNISWKPRNMSRGAVSSRVL